MAKPKESEPASYMQYESTGQGNFGYARNKQADKVTMCDPPIKNLGKLRYNIITGSLQEWFWALRKRLSNISNEWTNLLKGMIKVKR